MHKENGKFFVDCSSCGKEFEVGKNTYYKNEEHVCPRCQVKLQKHPTKLSRSRWLILLECQECHKEFAISQGFAEERRKKYGVDLCTSCSKKGDKNPFAGKSFSEKQRTKLSEIRSAYYNDAELGEQRRKEVSEKTSGENNPMYKGVEFRSDYTWRNKSFRMKVLKRDNYTCQKCHTRKHESELRVHHKDGCNWNIDRRLDVSNGVTLCDDCHKLFHHIYGYGDNTVQQFDEFLQEGSETIEKVS